MKYQFLHIGHGNYVNLDTVKYIVSADADKISRYRSDRGIDKKSTAFFNATSNKETHSMIVHKDGTVCASGINAKTLVSRAAEWIADQDENE